MAAQVAAREARDFREAPTLRLTSGAGLEEVGAVELEEEEEEENAEEAAARRARSFAQDARVRFLGGRLAMVLGFTEEKWSQYLESEDNRQVLGEFLESTSPACLVFSFAASGRLAASQEIPRDANHKLVFISKKITESIGVNDFSQVVLFGELPALSLGHVSAFLDEILVPVLSNKNNHKSWSCFTSQDMEYHIEVMKKKMYIFRGKMSRRTLLPIPTVAGKIDLDQNCSENKPPSNERIILHAIESVVIEWSHQIQEIIERDSVQRLLNGLHLSPQAELDFWMMRRENLSCIYDQLQAPIVLKMVKILTTKQSSYFPTLKDIFLAVENALLEAQDVELYLRPLRRHIQCLQETEFPQTRILIAPLFHTICLIWSHSKFYNTPARVIVLLQEFCNLFINQAIAYLSPEDLLRGEIEESLEKLQVAVNILKTFKNSFFNYRKKLASYFMGRKLRPWDFQSHLVFCRFDKFLDRLIKIEDIFATTLEFEKLERLEFGGTKGAILNGQVHKMSEELMELYKLFKQSTYDPSDCNNMEFESDYVAFKSKTLEFDRRLGTIICEAFLNCNGLEAAFKLLTIFGNFLEKPVVMEIFSLHYSTLVHMFNTELDVCKQLYNEHMKQIECGHVVLNKNMPFTSGNMKWAQQVLQRLQMFWSNFASLRYLFLGNPDHALVYQKYVEMTTLLDQFESRIYNEWKSNVDEICEFNLNQPLVKFSAINGLLCVNFDPKLVAVLREVKYLLMLKKQDIPDSALAIFKKRNTILKYIGNLDLLVQGYNKLKQTLLEVEYPLIEDELRAIDKQLTAATTWLTWQDDCWGYIERVRAATSELEHRVERTQKNVKVIQQTMRGWARCVLPPRREHRREAAFTLEDKGDLFTKKYKLIQGDGCKIHNLVEENRKLFKADPSLDTWKIYVEFIDDIVVEGFFQAIMHDLDFFLKNTEKQLKPAPFFQAQMILLPPEIVFKPSLDREAGDGFYDLVEEMLCNSFRMSAQMNRIATHLEIKNYQDDMDNMLGLAEVRQEIMNRVVNVINKVLDFRNTLETHAYLWVDDRAEFMKHFLLYGHAVSSDEMDAHANEEIPEQPPTLEQFKEQIDIYEALYVQMSKFADFRVFDSWFKVDMKPFKVSLLTIIKKWSWMFQEHLLRFVIDSLNELQEFIKETDSGLQRELNEGDHDGLVDIMGHLLAVRSRQRATDELFEPLKETITLLESYGQKMPEQVYIQLEELPERWETTKKIAATVRHEVSPLHNAEVTLIRKKCILFDAKQAEFRERFRHYAPLGFNAENPYTALDEANEELEALEEEMLQMQESTRLFEVALPEYKQMKQCRKEIKLLKGLWDVIIYVRRSIDNWTKTQWRQINVEQMDVELRRFAKEIWSLNKEVRVWDAYTGLEDTVKDMTASLRAITELQSPALRDRHWHQLMKAIGVKFLINEATTLADLLALQLHRVEDDIRRIVDKAVKELGTEKVITEISQTWATMKFSYEVHYRTGIPLLKSDEQLFETLEHNQVQLQTLLQSKYVEYFIEQVLSWQNKLNIADVVIFTWMEVQRTWSHLESIFVCSEDIRIQLVKDARRFDGVDAEFKELMFKTAKVENVLEATCRPNLYEKLKDLQSRLSLCEKALAEYLETKRIAFPRFYFVSSADLLDILSKGAQPKQVTCHLAKLFDSIADLQFEDNQDVCAHRAVGMYSKEKEYVPFQAECECVGHVETWLLQLEQTMQETVRHSITEAIVAYEEKPRELWIFDFPAQVALTSSQIWWTTDVGIAFSRLEEGYETALKDFHKKQVVSPQAFTWLSQLRHRWEDTQKHCFVNICDAQFQYFYEYLGNSPRLVITPLTDRCYITLTQSLHLTMSGAPAGPAGTGKTETTKDLGRALGMMVYVFNCSKQMDYKSVGNIYKGLVQTGAWGCFDEFNRISVEVLSVVAVQVKMIHDAIRNRKKRPCAMVAPDIELICEILLVAEGFVDARALARKFITLYTLCKELLSKQDHYDWGLRAIKSVLVVAGSLKRGDKNRPEDQVLMRALRDFNMPKIVTDDIPVFLGLVGDLFPALDVPRRRKLHFEQMVRQSTLELRLQPEESFILKSSPVLFYSTGLFSSILREQANLKHDGPKWIVLDGDIDPMWIESLNTVMDDNKTLCVLLECLLTPENVPSDSPKEVYEVYFVFACIWAFGGTLLQDQISDYQADFSRWWQKEMKAVKFPSQGTIFDYYVDHKTKKLLPWADKIAQFTMDPDVPLQTVLVHTTETARLRYFMELLLEKGKPLMLVGNAGVGKTVFLGDTLASLSEDYIVSRVPFNYYTTSTALQKILEKPLEKKAGHNYGPGGNKKLIYFIDDMNMPEVDLYGTVQPHTLIRQHIDYGHWYDRQKVMLKEIHNCQYVACMNPMVGSFTINPRLQGILFASPECLKGPLDLIHLWLHESARVYGDKLIDKKDCDLFQRRMLETACKYFEGIDSHMLLQQPLIYCHFANRGKDPHYMPVKDWEVLKTILTETLDNYNELNAAMHLVLFEDAMQHVCRISRILRTPQGCALLVGVGGSGKQSLSRLAAYLCGLEVFQITLTEGYGIQELRVDLANLYIRTGAKNMPTVFLLTDAQVLDESFLVLINDLLASVHKDSISLFMAHVHTTVNEMSTRYYQNERRHNYTTPKSFLEQISLFKNLLKKKQNEVSEKKEHLVNGIQKLKTTASQVGDLKARLASQEAELQLRNHDAEALITKIGLQTEKVSREKTIADAEERKVTAIQTEVFQKQRECEADLLKAEPALVAATAALNTLNRVNLSELKAFPNPPIAVTNVTAAVMVLLAPRGRVPKDRSWKAAKVFMGKVDDFLQALINYDKEHIPENCLKVVNEHYLKDPEFNPNLIRTKSFAAAGLCAWVINIIKFYEVYCDVEPKRQALAQANLELAAATEKLEAIRKKLVSEKIRWGQSIKSFEAQEKTLCGDVLLTAAFVSYVGPFTRQYRQELVHCKWVPFLQQKVSIPITEGLDLISMLTDDATIAAWNNEGLPSDRMSTENAAILTHCERWPLVIDPQQQGIKWIKNKYGMDLKVTHLGQKGFLNAIETALAFGDVILIENLEETIDPVLDPLLGRNTIKKGKYIRIGDKECEFNKNFRLILHTKLANPHYKPELQAQTTLLNFTVTEDGLEAQLLAEVVSIERPDLEKLKLVLTKHQNDFKIELKYLEDDLLLRLSAAEGSFLDDTKLVERLEATKATAAEIERKVIEAKENERKINEARECYRPVAARASLLYFVINDLQKINPLYQFSLKAFNVLFHRAIEQADQVEDMQGRISVLMESITYAVFLYTSQALFEKDKLTFLSQMAFQILLRKKEIDPLELDFLLRFTVEHTHLSPVDFLTSQSWSAIKAIAVMEEFRGIDRDVEGSAKQWRKWVESECPEKEKLPQEWKKKTLIQKLILLRAMRPDRMTYALRNFVEEKLGAKYVERTRLDLVKAFEESSPATPVFFILSPGVDALKDLEILGKRLGFTIDSGKFHNVSLGQGQETVAEVALEKASKGGHWVILQVPWEDLRYLFGEIMYGGHITDDWDRKLCRVYLEEFMNPSLIEDELMLAPGFAAPPYLDYAGYHQYIEEMLPPESPALYGLHPNAEIEFLTVTSNTLFRTLLEMQPRNALSGDELGQSTEEKVKNVLDDILEKLPEEFNMAEIMQKNSNRSPYVLVCFQECERMNILIREIRISLEQLDRSLKGELALSPAVEAQQFALSYDTVPDTWSKLAYPSTYGLAQWFNDLLLRCRELDTWTQDLTLPAVVWLSGFFNPQSFLTGKG
ncbi:DNAH11 isoform 4 [Pan troglodytes]|uniref:DNAH11 isoform 4 n=1 Tax=Pan troglodytes TaxID=9598 RepID=A0A2J8MER0_PANTR|nr:DNAH11 isoform 4 [Pan troglodytes]